MNTKSKNNNAWIQLNSNQKIGVLQALAYECIPYIKPMDYRNTLLVCREWNVNLSRPELYANINCIIHISSPLIERFVSRASQIDRSNIPKSYKACEVIGAMDMVPMTHEHEYPLTQEAYEIRELKMIRNHEIDNAYSANQLLQLRSIEDMNDQERNKLLDVVHELNNIKLISKEEVITSSISYLINRYTDISTMCPELETIILKGNILPIPQIVNHEKNINHKLLIQIMPILILTIFTMIIWLY